MIQFIQQKLLYHLIEGDTVMPMHLVIQKKRKALGLTQEQVADYLNVSIPAVSKWETGATCPDISLLPPLARLLKIDLNTLFCFQEDISHQEITLFCRKLTSIVQTQGLAEGFEAAKRKICEYPHNETLLHSLALHLDGMLNMSGLSPDEKSPFSEMILAWYRQLSESGDPIIKNSADYMLVSRMIQKGDYDEAQRLLDTMPDREDGIHGMADKLLLQVTINQKQGQPEKAVKNLQYALFRTLNKVQMLLYRLVDLELASGGMETAKAIAEKASKLPALLDLWEYPSLVPLWQIALAEKNADQCICILRKMLAAMLRPWDMRASPLFHSMFEKSNSRQMFPVILSELERDPALNFLQGNDEFRALISEYKALI